LAGAGPVPDELLEELDDDEPLGEDPFDELLDADSFEPEDSDDEDDDPSPDPDPEPDSEDDDADELDDPDRLSLR
jgi:hypothetical protein